MKNWHLVAKKGGKLFINSEKMEIEILKFSPESIKDLILKKIEENEKYKDYELFKKFVTNVIDEDFVMYQISSIVTFGLVDLENTIGSKNDVEQYDLASFLLTFKDIFTNKKYYKYNFSYKKEKDDCRVVITYEKLFKEEDHFDYKIQQSLKAFASLMSTTSNYEKVVTILLENTLKKVYYAFLYTLKSVVDKKMSQEMLIKDIFFIIAEQKANEQYIKYLKKQEEENANNKK